MHFSIFYTLLHTMALAEPQPIPDEDTGTETSTEEGEQNAEQNDSVEDNKNSDTLEEDSTPETSTEEDVEQNGEEHDSVEEMSDEEFERRLEEALQEMNAEENSYEIEDTSDTKHYRGNFDTMVEAHLWNSNDTTSTMYSWRMAGDPQYLFSKGKFGPTVGMRFQVNASESLQHKISDHLIGITTGLQMGAVRFNTSMSYFYNQLFHQTETNRYPTAQIINYDYQELPKMHGLLWEQTLTFATENRSIPQVQLSVGFPYKLTGDRELGAMFQDSLETRALVAFKILSVEYQYNVYPTSVEHVAGFGSAIVF